jgi:hypothetical protein
MDYLRKLWPGPCAWIAFAVVVVMLYFAELRDPSGRYTGGILPFELAGTSDGALALMRTYDDLGLIGAVWKALGFDLILIAGYASLVIALLAWLGQKGQDIGEDPLDSFAASGILLAAALDVLEDAAMASMLLLRVSAATASPLLDVAAFVATICALTKWTLIVAIAGHCGWRLVKWMVHRLISTSPSPPSATRHAAATDEPPASTEASRIPPGVQVQISRAQRPS